MATSEMEVFPEYTREAWEQCMFNPDFPELERLIGMVRNHGKTLFQPFDHEGLRVEPLELHVPAVAKFRMQPCRYERDDVLNPLRALIDQFVAEGVVRDNDCTFASPLVIVHKKDGGIRMEVSE
jgi:hypothetical protein